MLKRLAVSMVAVVGAAGISVPQTMAAEVDTVSEPVAAKECSLQVESGTLKWGIKQSWRNYIKGRIANGKWETSGAVTEGTGENTGKDFQYSFTVDPSNTTITVKDGKIVSSEIRTKESSIVFTGHKEALYSEVKSPMVKTSGSTIDAGSGYVGYYVPGKNMAEYTKADRTEANKKQGEGFFSQGSVSEAKLSGDTLTLKGRSLQYTPQPGTNNKEVDGVDVLFMGNYTKGTPVDDVDIELKVKNTCGDIDGTINPDNGGAWSGSSSNIWGILLGIAGVSAVVAALFHAVMNFGLLQHLPFGRR
ncbi:HtaA domain-containing protein [Corynebacterium kutscheri]|uniref:Htaa protein n=1 Tax=Corynebacterium kutscheri TaxID=35755 RepID=A0A0F6QZS0_9CORY|nr:HtaA domain-containing protein [Corynebacterium kutscheri]AKE40855.1 Htaa protein [Corynebacterium kutscheri]VEH06592.1 membrane protein [Corynebacterium kutscheri]VEH09152.1 membrane protein [Corynebacterium kutscheri]